MTSIDFREIMYSELQDAEFRREFVQAYFEQDGVSGIRSALRCIAEADRYAQTGVLPPEHPRKTKRVVRRGTAKRTGSETEALRRKLLRHGFDFRIADVTVAA